MANKLQLSTLLSIITVLNAHALLINRKLYAGQIICHKQQQNSLYTFANFEIVIALFEQWRNLISLSPKLKDNQFSASFLKKDDKRQRLLVLCRCFMLMAAGKCERVVTIFS